MFQKVKELISCSYSNNPVLLKYANEIEILLNRSYLIAEEFRLNHGEESLGYEYYGRIISTLMSSKTLLFSLNLASKQKSYLNQYLKNVLPESFQEKSVNVARNYMKETHTSIRFTLFQHFYSQTESSYRKILRSLEGDNARDNPFIYIGGRYGLFEEAYARFLNHIRNTIHNNGFFFPRPRIEEFEYTLGNKNFRFEYGNSIEQLHMDDILIILSDLIESNRSLFLKEEVLNLNPI